MTNDALAVAIQTYFRGERQEMYAILAYAAALLGIGLVFIFLVRGGFGRGFGGALVAVALLGVSIAVPLLLRDPGLERALLAALGGDAAPSALAAESARLGKVVASYAGYRYLFGGLALAGLLAVLLTRSGWANGVAAGLFVLFATQLVIDRYSEERAMTYAEHLKRFSAAAPSGSR